MYLFILSISTNLNVFFFSLINLGQVAIGRRLGIEEPRLMKIMKATLFTHNEWFKLQMCKDRFEIHLKIDSLKEVNTPLLTAAAMSNSNADSSALGSSQVTISSSTKISEDGSSPTQVSSRDVVCDENAILKVMVSCGYILLVNTVKSK